MIMITAGIPFVSDDDLYTGTVADFSGMDPIIYREPLQTEQYDSMSLNGKLPVSSSEFSGRQNNALAAFYSLAWGNLLF